MPDRQRQLLQRAPLTSASARPAISTPCAGFEPGREPRLKLAARTTTPGPLARPAHRLRPHIGRRRVRTRVLGRLSDSLASSRSRPARSSPSPCPRPAPPRPVPSSPRRRLGAPRGAACRRGRQARGRAGRPSDSPGSSDPLAGLAPAELTGRVGGVPAGARGRRAAAARQSSRERSPTGPGMGTAPRTGRPG